MGEFASFVLRNKIDILKFFGYEGNDEMKIVLWRIFLKIEKTICKRGYF